MDKIINVEHISGIEGQTAVAQFIESVNKVDISSRDAAELVGAVIEGAIRAISELEARVSALEK